MFIRLSHEAIEDAVSVVSLLRVALGMVSEVEHEHRGRGGGPHGAPLEYGEKIAQLLLNRLFN